MHRNSAGSYLAVGSGRQGTIVVVWLALSAFTGCGSNLQPAVAIEATVSGLKGSGLELWVNGHDPVPMTADGAVTLAYMAGGYHYSVTVKTQPSNPSQTCTVANATGVVGAADVTDVMVTCVTSYAIGGTVNGLDGSGLVLHSSLGDDLAITGNGSFVFPTRAGTGAEYVVTVKTQPTPTPPKTSETCSVGSAQGSVASSDVLNIAVICSTDAFKVGGMISGLVDGTTAVLKINGSDDLTVTNNGGFTFSTAVASGATYEVKVKMQPTNPWQTCTITNGTGTIASTNVSTVSVACTINQYAIVVYVSGLQGSGLVLQNNGGDDLAVMANGNSTFAIHLASGTSYSVTVKTQPSSPTQFCTVTSGSGTVGGVDVTNVSVTCHGWGTAQLIGIGSALCPQVVMNASGNAIVVGYQYDGMRYNIWANRYVVGSGWSTAQFIETNNTGDAWTPQVAMDSSGNAIAVWRQSDGTYINSIWANRYVAGSGWGTAEPIETGAGDAQFPQVAIDASGNATAVWFQSDGARDNIWANRYVVGSGWGTTQLIETDNAGGASIPQVAMDASGNAIAVWSQYDGTRYNILANRYAAGSGWGTAEPIETDNAGGAHSPQLAMDASGNATAVWFQSDGARDNIWANRYVVGSGWGTAQFIETDNAGNTSNQQVAMDSSGNAIAVWNQSDGTRYHIWANRYSAGSWGTAQLIETDNSGDATAPQVAMDASGDALAVWQQYDGTQHNILANRYVVGSGWSTAQLIETDSSGDAKAPQVVMNTSGSAFVVWWQTDGTNNGTAWASRGY